LKASGAVSVDPGDTKFLLCAETAQADYIVTGNKRHFPEAS
jgi:predicted nucleic acid-binding protein